MHTAHNIWAQSLNWLSPPLRLALFGFLVLALVLRGVPALLQLTGRVVRAGATPAMIALTYPEYLTTSLSRRLGWRLLPGTFGYGRMLGAAAAGLERGGSWLQLMGRHRPRLPRKTQVIAVGLLLAAWFVQVEWVPEPLQPSVAAMRADVTQLDSWLGTGHWTTRRAPTPNRCPAPAKRPTRPGKAPRR